MHMTPAQYVIYVFKGVRATARAVGRTPSSVSKWQKARIPSAAHRRILDIAKEKDLDIQPQDLIYGRTVAKR